MCLGSRTEQLKQALFRGDTLHMQNAAYAKYVSDTIGTLLELDLGAGDLTSIALSLTGDLNREPVRGQVIAKSAGVIAGVAEYSWLLQSGGMQVQPRKNDGDAVERGEVVAEIAGARSSLLAYERVGLNLMQRMSGIATMTRNYLRRVRERSATTCVVGTRKTPWGLLDKRALHLGGGGTHRLGLWDAILVKNNHLALLAAREEDAVVIAARRAWEHGGNATFVEIEVRSESSAVAAAEVFRELRETREAHFNGDRKQSDSQMTVCPCLLLLDNMAPTQITRIVDRLRTDGLLQHILIEASGAISHSTLDDYADCGADAISIGALTHSAQALDLSQRIG